MTGILSPAVPVGVPDLTASLAADLGARAFGRAFDCWIEPSSQRGFVSPLRRSCV
jgi:hypothetical protein